MTFTDTEIKTAFERIVNDMDACIVAMEQRLGTDAAVKLANYQGIQIGCIKMLLEKLGIEA